MYLVVDDGLHEGGDVLLRLEAEVALENFHEGVALQCATQPAVLRKRQRQGRAIQSWWLRRRRGKSKGTTAGQVRAGQGRKVPSAAAEQSEQNNKDEEQQVSVSAVSVTIYLNAELSMRRARAS